MPRLKLSYKVSDAGNSFPDDEINVEEFIGIKSYKAKGKRLSTREIDTWEFLEPFQPELSEEETEEPEAPEVSGVAEEPMTEGPDASGKLEVPEKEERIAVNPNDVPLEIEVPKGDGVQMDLFGGDL